MVGSGEIKQGTRANWHLLIHPLDDYEFILKHVCTANTLKLQDLDSMNGSRDHFRGMVASSREGTNATRVAYTIFRIEDYYGSYEIALFSEDSVTFGRYARPGLSIYITARVQPKRYRQEELEVKISSISLLSEVKDKLVSKITLQIPLSQLDDTTVTELSALVKNNSGNSLLYFNVMGEEMGTNIRLFSRQERVRVGKQFIDNLTNNLGINFEIN